MVPAFSIPSCTVSIHITAQRLISLAYISSWFEFGKAYQTDKEKARAKVSNSQDEINKLGAKTND
jgi:hypothetical protein